MDIFSYGITTSRYDASLLWEGNKLITASGCNLAVWNLDSLTREKVYQYNTNAVMSIIENSNFIFSLAYNGEVCILDRSTLALITKIQCEGKCTRHASATDDYLAVSAEVYPETKGITTVFSLANLKNKEAGSKVEQVFAIRGAYELCHVLENGKLFVVKENVSNDKERQEWRDAKKLNPELTKDSKPKKQYNHHVYLFDIATQTEVQNMFLEHPSPITSSQSNRKDLVNYIFLDRQMIVINPNTFEISINTKIAGSGAILASKIQDRKTFFSPKAAVLVEIDHDKVKDFPATFELDKQLDSARIYKLPGSGIDSKIYCYVPVNEKTGVICFEDGINIIDLVSNKTQKISCFNITCCGVALSSTSDLIACGDFTGNVMLFSSESALHMEPLAKTFIMESVRTVTFDSKNESVLIGTLSGKLYRWWTQDFSEPRTVATFQNAVLNIRYNYHSADGNNYLLVGLGDGMFAMLKELELEHNMMFIMGYYGHMPSNLPPQKDFGSLHKYAEIWSTVWSPTSNNFLVTASEDQTCCIWDITEKNPKLAHKLVGHTKAVTSVDWRVMSADLGELFVSCSDDQTIRVYDPNDSFKLLFVAETSFIKEWHTLTYLSLEKGGTRVAVGAQNGFLFVYDLLKKEFLFAERIHNGSVEGLDWKEGNVVTCSADNTISVIRLPKTTKPDVLEIEAKL